MNVTTAIRTTVVALAALALPVLGATAAQAAPAPTTTASDCTTPDECPDDTPWT